MAKVKHSISIAHGVGQRCSLCSKQIKEGKKMYYKKGLSGIFSGNYCSLQCFNAKYN